MCTGTLTVARTLFYGTDLRAGATWSQEVYDQQNDAHNEGNMNETAGYVKRDKPEQPKNDKNSRQDSEHVVQRPF